MHKGVVIRYAGLATFYVSVILMSKNATKMYKMPQIQTQIPYMRFILIKYDIVKQKSAVFSEHQHDCKYNLDFIKRLKKQEGNIK